MQIVGIPWSARFPEPPCASAQVGEETESLEDQRGGVIDGEVRIPQLCAFGRAVPALLVHRPPLGDRCQPLTLVEHMCEIHVPQVHDPNACDLYDRDLAFLGIDHHRFRADLIQRKVLDLVPAKQTGCRGLRSVEYGGHELLSQRTGKRELKDWKRHTVTIEGTQHSSDMPAVGSGSARERHSLGQLTLWAFPVPSCGGRTHAASRPRPELPSLSWLAPCQIEALQRLEAVVLSDMAVQGEEIPAPFPSGPVPARSTSASGLHCDLVVHAAEDGVSLNQYVVKKLASA